MKKQEKALTQELAWERHRQELIKMICSRELERDNEIVIATIADTDDAILTTIDLIPMDTDSIVDDLECIAGTFKGRVITPEETKLINKRLTAEQLEEIYERFIIPGVNLYYQRLGFYPEPKCIYGPNAVNRLYELHFDQLKKLVERAVNEIEAGEDL